MHDYEDLSSCLRLATEADEESQVAAYYRKYQGHGPAYYGDLDESNDALLEYEVQAEEQGIVARRLTLSFFSLTLLQRGRKHIIIWQKH